MADAEARDAAAAAFEGLAIVFETVGRGLADGQSPEHLGDLVAMAGDHFRLLAELLNSPPASPDCHR